ncbi:hypothetical protein JL722_9006 [Aureococcus anophagefferens]|nr:hypothetical protein JL722_9006 [Aureococcus anophagefferens]
MPQRRSMLWCLLATASALQPPQIIAAASSREMRRIAALVVEDGSRVLELGSQLSSTTAALKAAAGAGRVVAVDVARKTPKTKTERSAQFRGGSDAVAVDDFREVAAARDIPAALAPDERFDVVVVDTMALAGMDLALDTLALVRTLRSRQRPPPLCVVKSAALARLGGRLFSACDLSRVDDVLRVAAARRRRLDAGRVYEAEPVVVAAVGVDEYRSVIPTAVRPGDATLELGCHFGTIRTSTSASATWATAGLAALAPPAGWDAVFVDVGGLSSVDGTLEALGLVRALGAALDPRIVVIKSKCLRNLAETLVPSSRVSEPLRGLG